MLQQVQSYVFQESVVAYQLKKYLAVGFCIIVCNCPSVFVFRISHAVLSRKFVKKVSVVVFSGHLVRILRSDS